MFYSYVRIVEVDETYSVFEYLNKEHWCEHWCEILLCLIFFILFSTILVGVLGVL